MSNGKSTKESATQRPWQAERDDVPYDGGFETWVINADGAGICMMDCPQDDMEANAQLIVTAVNAHHDLLAACRVALVYFEQCVMSCDPDEDDIAEVIILRSAIKKGEGETK